MKDSEQIYALYVQANPVPDPDLLAPTQDEAVLLTIEGSQDMTTQETVKKHSAPRNTRRNGFAAVAAFAAVIVIGLVAVLLANSSDSGPVAAADAAPTVAFDGTTCSYDGPTQIEEGTVEFSITNTTDVDFTLAGWLMAGDALAAELERTPVGSDMPAGPADPVPEGELVFGWQVSPVDSVAPTWPLAAGTYLLDCKTDDHVWRAAQIEVLVP